MERDIAIQLVGVGKRYYKHSGSLTDLKHMWFGSSKAKDAFWSLRDISFTLRKGDTVGILGGNGSGKSTLLKIILGVTSPTVGKVNVRGTIGGLIELGAGFHKEMTGRENIYINGVILGLKEKEIDSIIDEIIAFSGLESFIDTPIKHYSSGMKVRLGFSIAIHLVTDIILLDEVLAVGDARFKKKAMEAIEDYLRNKTILLVSHSASQVKKICKKAIVLDRGTIVFSGETDAAIAYYQEHIVDKQDK